MKSDSNLSITLKSKASGEYLKSLVDDKIHKITFKHENDEISFKAKIYDAIENVDIYIDNCEQEKIEASVNLSDDIREYECIFEIYRSSDDPSLQDIIEGIYRLSKNK